MDDLGIELQENELSNISRDINNRASSCRSYLNRLKTYSGKSISTTGLFQSGFKLTDLLHHQDSVQKCFLDILAMEEGATQPNPEELVPQENIGLDEETLVDNQSPENSMIQTLSDNMQGLEIISNITSVENQKSSNSDHDQQPLQHPPSMVSKESTIPASFKALANKVRFMESQNNSLLQELTPTTTITTTHNPFTTPSISTASTTDQGSTTNTTGAIPKKYKSAGKKGNKINKISARFFTNKTKSHFTPTHISTTTTTSMSSSVTDPLVIPSLNVQTSSIPMNVFKSSYSHPVTSTAIDNTPQSPIQTTVNSQGTSVGNISLNPLATTFSINQSIRTKNPNEFPYHTLPLILSNNTESSGKPIDLDNIYEIPKDNQDLNEDEQAFMLSELQDLEKHIAPPTNVEIEFFEHQVDASIEGAKTYLHDIDNLLQDIEKGVPPSKDETNMIKQHIKLNEINKARASSRALDDLTIFRKILEMQTTTLEILQSQQIDILSLKAENKKLREILLTQHDSQSDCRNKQTDITTKYHMGNIEDKSILTSNNTHIRNLEAINSIKKKPHTNDNQSRVNGSSLSISQNVVVPDINSEKMPAPKLRESRTQYLKRCSKLGFLIKDIKETWEHTKKNEKISTTSSKAHKVSSGIPSVVLASKNTADEKIGTSPELTSLKKILDDITELSLTRPRVAISKAIQTISSYNLTMPNPPTLPTVLEVITNYIQQEDGKLSTESDEDGSDAEN